MTTTSTTKRYYSLDGLRASMMLLGLLLHASVSYLERPIVEWGFKDPSTSIVFDYLLFFIHIFRMPVFYVMAGFFAAMLYVRRGFGGLARNRFTRIVIPFAVGWVFLIPANGTGFRFAQPASDGTFADGWAAVVAAARAGELFPKNSTDHLWFLYFLILFYAAFLVLVPLVERLPAGLRQRVRAAFEWLVRSNWRSLVLAVPTFLIIMLMPRGNLETSVSFIPVPRVLLIYVLFFGFGWLLYGSRKYLPYFERGAWTQNIAAIALMPVNMWTLGKVLSPDGGRMYLVIAAATTSLMIWWLIFGITGLFLRYFDRPSPRVRYVVDSSYWIYLIHLPFTIWVPGLLSHLALPAMVKFLLVLALCCPVWWASYDLLVRNTFIGKVLNGRRYPRGLPSPEPGPEVRLAEPA